MADAIDPAKTPRARPLSPHLSIYRQEITMVMSIVHRATGVALYAGTVLLAWWLIAAATGPGYHAYVQGLLATVPAKVVLLGFTWALFHHMLGGLRHLIWDTGRAFAPAGTNALGWLTIVGSVILTAAFWLVVDKGAWL